MINQSKLPVPTSLCMMHECGDGLAVYTRDSVVVELRAYRSKLHREDVSTPVKVL